MNLLLLSKPRRAILAALALLLSVLLGLVDYYSGPDFSIGILYVVPVGLAAWYVGPRVATIISLVCAALWFYCMRLQMPWEIDKHPLIVLWNFLDGLSIFLAQVYTITRLKKTLKQESWAARTDSLTGSHNSRSFYDLAQRVMANLDKAHAPFTFLYFDVDHFKQVNDKYGHLEGDQLLHTIADTVRANLRSDDVLARLGGDEFAVLLPQANAVNAQMIASRLQRDLHFAAERAGWPVTFSMGMCTYLVPPPNVETMIKEADALMYSVKTSGKNSIRHQIHTGSKNVKLIENIDEEEFPLIPSRDCRGAVVTH